MTSLGWALADGAVVAKRNLIKIKRVPEVLVWVLMSPIMFVLLFVYVFGSSINVPGVPYNHVLEDWFMVNPTKIADGIRKLAAY